MNSKDLITKTKDGSGDLCLPNRSGFWLHVPSGDEMEIYELEPTGGQLCFWGPEHGFTYTGACDRQSMWDDDKWQGHILVHHFDDKGPWKFLRELSG